MRGKIWKTYTRNQDANTQGAQDYVGDEEASPRLTPRG